MTFAQLEQAVEKGKLAVFNRISIARRPDGLLQVWSDKENIISSAENFAHAVAIMVYWGANHNAVGWEIEER